MQKSVFFAVTVLATAAGTAAHAQTMVESGALTSRAAAPAMSAPAMTVPAPAMSAPPPASPVTTAPAPMAPRYTMPGAGPGMTPPMMGGPSVSAAPVPPPSTAPTAPEHPLSPAEMEQMARDLPLFQAAFDGDTPAIKRALAKGAKVNSADWQYGFTPLMWASLRGKLGSVHYLLSKGAKVNVFSRPGISITLAAAKRVPITEMQNGQPVGVVWTPTVISPIGSVTPLMAASANGYNLTVRELLKNRADPNFVRSAGITPLMMAVLAESTPTVVSLLDRGAKVNSFEAPQAPALQYAAFTGNIPIIRLLLRHGADPTIAAGGFHVRPGMAARMMNHVAAARILEAAAREWKPKPVPVVAVKPVVKVPQPAPDDDDGVTILN